jgi:hypothetical protein
MRNAMMLITLVFAIEASALWLLPVSDAPFLADQAEAVPALPIRTGYHPPPDWMHRGVAARVTTTYHVLTNAGLAPSLARWTPLP